MRQLYRVKYFALLATAIVSTNCQAQRPTHDGKVVLFGNLHAHSKLSDDISGAGNEMLPSKAFQYAFEHGVDFLAITDHHKAIDSNHRISMEDNEYKTLLFDVAMQFNASHSGEFIAIPGIEWGNTATGNHLNVFGAAELPPDSILGAEYDELFAWAASNAEFVQFNHPNSWSGKSNRNKSVGNFGEALFSTTSEYVSAVNPSVKTVSIICTVRNGHLTGEHRHSEDKTHRKMQWENHYKKILNMGFHISPSANQDTHSKNWGTVTAARTAAWAASASYHDLMKAFKANRVYASEDDEMAVVYQVRYQGKTYWMGETVPIAGDEADVIVLVKVWQGVGTNNDSTDEGPYTVDVLSDHDGFGGRRASVWTTVEDVPAETEIEIPLQVVAGEYIYLQITEQNGKDNPVGDGIDEFNNSTGAAGNDGLRDNMNDSAWTSPIWFVGQQASFVWSIRRDLYHDAHCWAAANIGAANRRESTTAPSGKTKHNCPPAP